jgi:rhamnogalacturonan endolyase
MPNPSFFARGGLMLAVVAACGTLGRAADETAVLFEDGFATLRPGAIGTVAGAKLEYHYLPDVNVAGPWAVSAFVSAPASQLAWRVARHGGEAVVLQTFSNTMRHTHPTLVAGDVRWKDYDVVARFTPNASRGRTGIGVRHRNDRCQYVVGVEDGQAVLVRVRHETAFRVPDEEVLASRPWAWEPGGEITVEISVAGPRLTATFGSATAPAVTLTADDETFPHGRIALVADGPAIYSHVRVTATAAERDRCAAEQAAEEAESRRLGAALPAARLWKRFRTDGFGVGRNLRFGDLDGDGRKDILICQPRHHGPKDANSEVGCLTAVTVDGERLWQVGDPDPWNDELSNDVGVQIHDLDGDGRTEVVYCQGMELIVADGRTGATRSKVPTPPIPRETPAPRNRFPRILGDAIFFCDLRGQGRAGDLVLKDRYNAFWVFDERLDLQWQGRCNTGHYPFAADVDGDGREELFIGYSCYDHTGRQVWSLDDTLRDHADAVAFVRLSDDPQAEPVLVIAASDEGLLFVDPRGRILEHHRVGHVQNPSIADFRTDLPGLEVVAINFWGNQGLVHCYDAQGRMYHDTEPCQHGSMMLPVNWTGVPPEYWILSPAVGHGGMFDGHGRKVFDFPADGHPDRCVAVVDLTGDCRDEIVVWDPYEIWIYTQDDNPKAGRLYRPRRNAPWNTSNYHANVSLPGWSDDPP